MYSRVKSILKVAGTYLIFSILWIVVTDRLVEIESWPAFFHINTIKGIFFVTFSSLLIFWTLYGELKHQEEMAEKHLSETRQLLQQLQVKNQELNSAYDATIEVLVQALETRDKETGGHTRRVVNMLERLVEFFEFTEEDKVHARRGALLHDIGKIATPDSILLKPGKLTDQEWEIIKAHPKNAETWMSPVTFLKPAMDIPAYHHERWDGSGYPYGLKGKEIPLAARLFAVIDTADAMLNDRPYRKAISPREAYRFLSSQSGILYDPHVVKIFIEQDVIGAGN